MWMRRKVQREIGDEFFFIIIKNALNKIKLKDELLKEKNIIKQQNDLFNKSAFML